MKTKSAFLLIILLTSVFLAGAQSLASVVLEAEYGPPAEANVWEKFIIPITPESFNTDPATLATALENITSFWIRTEMHTGNDIGGIDEVMVGSIYSSYFGTSSEGWSSSGDGTMEWMPTGGIDGGYLQISDWATGDWHWLIAPSTWAGDWSSLNGQNIEFWYKTDKPSYSAIIKLTTEPVNRLVINTPVNPVVALNDSLMIQLEVIPAPTEDITVSFTSSDNNCVTVLPSVLIPAGYSTAYVYFVAAPDATAGCESVIEAIAVGYLTSRITMRVEDQSGISDPIEPQDIMIYPNPCTQKFTLSNTSGISIQQVLMYDLSGNAVLDLREGDLSNTDIDVADKPAGIYFLRVFVDKKVITSKVIIE